MTVKREFLNDISEFFKKYNLMIIILNFVLFITGSVMVTVGFYITAACNTEGMTKIVISGNEFATPGNLLQVIGAVAAGIALFKFYKMGNK